MLLLRVQFPPIHDLDSTRCNLFPLIGELVTPGNLGHGDGDRKAILRASCILRRTAMLLARVCAAVCGQTEGRNASVNIYVISQLSMDARCTLKITAASAV
jgi:hypothetical protein